MKIKSLKHVWMIALALLSLTSCIKNDIKELGTKGTPRVRIGESPENIQYFSIFTDVKTADLVTIRRDEVSQEDINKTVTVTVVNDPTQIESYNDANGTTFEPIPDSLYTVVESNGVKKSGDNFTVTFAPGISAITISIAIDGSKWDLAHTYAMYFKLTDGGGKTLYPDKTEAFAGVAVKNEWDGMYSYTGVITRNSADGPDPNLSGEVSGVDDIGLSTKGPNSVYLDGLYWHGGGGVGGVNKVYLTIDPATNLVTVKSEANATLKNTVGEDNYYDPDSKTFYLAFDWGVAPNTRVTKIQLKYTGPR